MSKHSWERTTEFLHPYVSFLVSGIETVREDIRNKNWAQAVRYLYWFIPYLDPNIKEKLREKRLLLKKMLNGTASPDADVLDDVLNAIMDELHREGYFAGAKHKIIYIGKESAAQVEIPEM